MNTDCSFKLLSTPDYDCYRYLMLLGYDDEGRGVMISNEGNFVNPLLYHLKM